MNTIKTEVAIIGGGPAGYVAAIRLRQLGHQVTLIEANALGGTCLNVGCIPTKVLLHSASLYHELSKNGARLGLDFEQLHLNWPNLQKRKSQIVKRLVTGVSGLMKAHEIEVIQAKASFIDSHTLKLTQGDVQFSLSFDKALIATGSRPAHLPLEGVEDARIVDSTGALALESIPERIVIVGAGVIGLEFASLYASMGKQVTVLEYAQRALLNFDEDVVHVLIKALEQQGVRFHFNVAVTRFKSDELLYVESATQSFACELCLVATGRMANTDQLNLDVLGLTTERGFIPVNPTTHQTEHPHIYAAGDVIGGKMLAHVAFAQGINVAHHIAKKEERIDMATAPSAVYTQPELASVGLSPSQAQAEGRDVLVGEFPLMANGKALILNEYQGLVKWVVDRKTHHVLGCQMVGAHATELMGEASLALRAKLTIETLQQTIHAHPTVSESLHEASHAVFDEALHIFQVPKP